MTWVETAVHFAEMSAIVSCTSHLVQKHFRASKVGNGDPFAQLLQEFRTRQSLSFMAVASLMVYRAGAIPSVTAGILLELPGEVCASLLQSNVRMDSLQSSSERCDLKLSCCMQSLVLMLSCSAGESHASSLLGSAISELTLDHAALRLPKCWTSSRTARRLLEMVYVYVACDVAVQYGICCCSLYWWKIFCIELWLFLCAGLLPFICGKGTEKFVGVESLVFC
ncbi:uncharacterized protein LOC124342213 [Daphnia pulicaria]|uniref:uncharacterized protein LOC124342213 n=1 Tax=Daphnia pulicaria TaxID=35523 RepID=UPI001EEBA67B|nr:uncharacterized protein LOC124342213 [Daphnia pulicaria]